MIRFGIFILYLYEYVIVMNAMTAKPMLPLHVGCGHSDRRSKVAPQAERGSREVQAKHW